MVSMLRAHFVLEPTHRLHLGQTFATVQRGTCDPLFRQVPGPCGPVFWATAREAGVGLILRFARTHPTDLRAPVEVTLWAGQAVGGAAQVLAVESFAARVPGWLGEQDRWSSFYRSAAWERLPGRLAQARAEAPGLRLPAVGLLSQNLLLAVTEQRVTGIEAMGGMRALLRRYGEPAPDTGCPDQPPGLVIFPPASVFAQVPDWAYHRAGFDRSRSQAMVNYARRAESFERFAADHQVSELAQALYSVPGIGPWTIAETLQRYCGHPDAISVGDYHLAHHVTYAFDGARGDDARMVQLLAPFTGHRQRVVALIKAAGISEPRRGPRYAPQDMRSF
ncbi:DNA-3-methyladenine glycosylase family protein [Rothia sp. 32237D007AR]